MVKVGQKKPVLFSCCRFQTTQMNDTDICFIIMFYYYNIQSFSQLYDHKTDLIMSFSNKQVLSHLSVLSVHVLKQGNLVEYKQAWCAFSVEETVTKIKK